MQQETLSMSNIAELLSTGADERIFLKDNGLNKYGLAPVESDIVNRGSCTCNPATDEDLELLSDLLENNTQKEDWVENLEKRTQDLKDNIRLKNGVPFEIFYAASGTGLNYYPPLFGRLMYPDRPILNIITCLEELGSGTKEAAQGQYFNRYSQFGEELPQGDYIVGPDAMETYFFKARSEKGEILNNEDRIEALINNHPDHTIIVNLVYGSKSGIEDNLNLIEKFHADNVMWNVDMCQFRHSSKIINNLLSKNALVMITGSKFYQSPPFCAAMLMPEPLFSKIEQVENWDATRHFNRIFSKYDVPAPIRDKVKLNDKFNVPGALRWACAINEIKRYNEIPDYISDPKILAWNRFVCGKMDESPYFELMPGQELTNNSIISFRMKYNGKYLNHQELKKLHKIIAFKDLSGEYPFRKLFIGQPVAYTNKSFLRMAIGSKNVRTFIDEGVEHFETDATALDIIETLLKEYHEDWASTS